MHVGLCCGWSNYMKLDDARFVQEELKQMLLAEELGFDSMWMTEHHFDDYSVSPAPLMTHAWLAANTKHMRLGTAVIVAPWHDPVRLAEQISWLDHLSGGRAIIGFGRGLARSEFEGLRIDQSKARELFDEVVSMVMNALETGFIEGGEIFKQPRREIRPRPLRSLKGRAFVAGGTPDSLRATARLGLPRLFLNQPMTTNTARPPFGGGKVTTGHVPTTADTPDDPWLQAWMEYRPTEPPPGPFVSNLVFVDDSRDRALELARIYAANTFRSAISHYEFTSDHHGTTKGYEAYKSLRMKPEDVEAAVEGVVQQSLYGTPKDVLTRFEEVVKQRKPQGLFPHLWTGGMPHDEVVRNMRIFAKHCLPELHSWTCQPLTIGEPIANGERLARPAVQFGQTVLGEDAHVADHFVMRHAAGPKMREQPLWLALLDHLFKPGEHVLRRAIKRLLHHAFDRGFNVLRLHAQRLVGFIAFRGAVMVRGKLVMADRGAEGVGGINPRQFERGSRLSSTNTRFDTNGPGGGSVGRYSIHACNHGSSGVSAVVGTWPVVTLPPPKGGRAVLVVIGWLRNNLGNPNRAVARNESGVPPATNARPFSERNGRGRISRRGCLKISPPSMKPVSSAFITMETTSSNSSRALDWSMRSPSNSDRASPRPNPMMARPPDR